MSDVQPGSTILTEAPVGNPATQMPPGETAQPPASNGGAPPATNGSSASTVQLVNGRFPLPDDLKAEPAFKALMDEQGTVDPLVISKSWLNSQKLIGGEKVVRPKGDDDKDGWDRWYKAAGRPDEPKAYELKRPDGLPEGFYDDKAEETYRAWAHETGLSQKQAAAIHERYVAAQAERHVQWQKEQTENKTKAVEALKREWGQGYDGNVKAAQAAMMEFADPDYRLFLDESGAGNDPRMIRAWSKIGKAMIGDTRLKGAGEVKPMLSMQELELKIADYRKVHKDALYKADHPDHDTRLKELTKLHEDLAAARAPSLTLSP